MKKLFTAALMLISFCLPAFSQMKMENKKVTVTEKEAALKTDMRKLWEDHITWTRNVILCLVDGTPGADQAVNRLMQNQVDIGNAVKTYYGEGAGNKLTELLKSHISIS